MKIKGFLLDLEGVLVGDKRYLAVEKAIEFVDRLRRAGAPFRVITNNTTHDRDTLVAKLRDAGFDFKAHEVHTCLSTAVEYLGRSGSRRVVVMGSPELAAVFKNKGLDVVDTSEADAVIVGLDTGFTYEKLSLACRAILESGASLVALHRNRLIMDKDGKQAPSAGALVAAVEYATRTRARIMGKPSPSFFQQALDALGLTPRETLVVSDDPFSDLAGAKAMGMKTAFVLTGKYGDPGVLEDLSLEERPDITVERMADLLTKGGIDIIST